MMICKKGIGTKNYSLLKYLLIFGVVVFLSGCIGLRSNGVKSGKDLYQTFFVGDDGTQYFIKPMIFSDESKNRLIIDFTFRFKDKIIDSVAVNMSFLNTEIIRDLDSLKITNGSASMVFKSLKRLFVERSQKEYNSRFSTKGSMAELNKLFDKNDWVLTAYKQNTSSNYNTPKETKKKIDQLKDRIFILF